jgi:hypothetical protein
MTEKENKNMMNACYKCKHRGTVPGDRHSCCNHPGRRDLAVKGSAYGVKSGWFTWPWNFDPVWLEVCSGFEIKDEEE